MDAPTESVPNTDRVITPAQAGTLDGLFRERVRRTPALPAYHYHDAASGQWRALNWAQAATEVARWRAALEREPLKPGDRVGILMHNRREWVFFDQAALALELIVVPLFFNDRTENVLYVLTDANVRLLVIEGQEQWDILEPAADELTDLERIISVMPVRTGKTRLPVSSLAEWLPAEAHMNERSGDPQALATIVYTSGTTGRPKGVMLSHHNILSNAWAGLQNLRVYPEDCFLSFLPLSHTFERTAGYYIPMMTGASIAHCRSIPDLPEDLRAVRPTGMVSVPRIFERIYAKLRTQLDEGPALRRMLFGLAVHVGWRRFEHRHGRARASLLFFLWPVLDRLVGQKLRDRLGGRLRCVISGGAPLSVAIARTFIALGVLIKQSYGLTETSPVLSVNTEDNDDPASVGPPLCNVETRIGENNELQVRGPNIMLGYWNNHNATYETIDTDGWLHTGDQARIDDHGRIHITGRLKEIIVLATGEKVPPADLELAIATDPLFEQVMILGEGRAHLSALTVLEPGLWQALATRLGLDPGADDALADPRGVQTLLERLRGHLQGFPGYARVHAITALDEPWTIENDLLTPTLKLRRRQLRERFEPEIEAMYEDDAPGDRS